MKARQQAYSRCSQLAASGQIRRQSTLTCSSCGKLKITSHAHGPIASVVQSSPVSAKKVPVPSKPWFWEGHVQNVVVGWLQGGGWTILEYANTAAKSPGKDIIAHREGRTMWVTVKGYPEGTAKTNPCTQARHWYSHAMFDLLCYRNESLSAELVMALPARGVTYGNLTKRCEWVMRTLSARLLWVMENLASGQ